MNKRQFLGVWIPRDIYLNPKLTWTEKILLVEINSLDNEQGCFASNEYFAEFLSCTTTTISTSISKLKKLGLVHQVSFDGRTRVLKADFKEFEKQSLKKFKGRGKENLKHNNTTNKTINKKEKINKKDLNDSLCINVEKLKENESWLEGVSMHLKINKHTTSQLLNEFISEQKLKGDDFKALKEMKTHFLNWSKIQVSKNRKQNNNWGKIINTTNVPKKQPPVKTISEKQKREMHKIFINDNLIKPYKMFVETGRLVDLKDYGGIITKELEKYKLLFNDKNVINKIKNEIKESKKLKSNTNKISSILKSSSSKELTLANEILKLTFKTLKQNKIDLTKVIQL